MKKDITALEDIKLLVDTFYKKAEADSQIGYVFSDVMDVNWDEHLPKMYGFWQILILGQPGVQSNPMQKHILVNSKERLTDAHFDRWIELWFETLDELFKGSNVETAKERTRAIRENMLKRIRMSESA